VRIHFELTSPDGSVIATGSGSTQSLDLASWDNHSLVMRQLLARGAPTRLGQILTMWVEVDHPVPIFPDETIDRAAESFHQALGTHLDTVGAVCSRSRDWVDAPVPEVVEALLVHGWVPPADGDDEAEETAEPESAGEGPRAVEGRRGVLTLCWSRGRRRDGRA
jgi:hypothetical protein